MSTNAKNLPHLLEVVNHALPFLDSIANLQPRDIDEDVNDCLDGLPLQIDASQRAQAMSQLRTELVRACPPLSVPASLAARANELKSCAAAFKRDAIPANVAALHAAAVALNKEFKCMKIDRSGEFVLA
jgi:hypothetical protein